GEPRLDLPRDARIERGEEDPGPESAVIRPQPADRDRAGRGVERAREPPRRGLRVRLPRRALGGGQLDELEPRMAREERHHPLTDGPRGAEDADGDLLPGRVHGKGNIRARAERREATARGGPGKPSFVSGHARREPPAESRRSGPLPDAYDF